jgi:hypothetical protein
MNPIKNSMVFLPIHLGPGIQLNLETGANHPPRNSRLIKALIMTMLIYSPKKNRAKAIPDYSTLYPETSSASASGKSKGCRFVSARADTLNLLNAGNLGTLYHTSVCALTTRVRFMDPAHLSTDPRMNPMETS